MTMICRAHSSVEVLSAFERSAGGIELIPLYPKPDEPAVNVIIRGVKDSRAVFRLKARAHDPGWRWEIGT